MSVPEPAKEEVHILLMEEIRRSPPGMDKTPVNNGITIPSPQLVSLPDF